MNGKLIFTEYNKRKLAMLFSGNRLVAVRTLPDANGRIGSVYVGKINKITPAINACFVEIQDGEMCFLPLSEAQSPFLLNRPYDGRLVAGDELAVQLTREAQKTKQPSVSAKISLSNEYFALSMDGSSHVGYSGKLSVSKKEQLQDLLTASGILQSKRLKQKLFSVEGISLPKIGGVVRTLAGEADEDRFVSSVSELCTEFAELLTAAPYRTSGSCLKSAPPVYQDVLDTFAYPDEYDEIITDDTALFEDLSAFCKEKMPEKKVRFYGDASYPLHKLYSIETRISEALGQRVWLKSGGYLVIEPTEALTVIDVNSGKYESRKNSAFSQINLEAAEEIALQLRLRNLSGMIVVDFINMNSQKQEEALLKRLRQLVKKDKIKTNVVDITPLGLVEITRKKCDRPFYEQWCVNCHEQ